MRPLPSSTPALAADVRTLDSLKMQSGRHTPEAIQESAKQFESLFMREMIKSMREATMKSGLLESEQGNLGAELLDQQLALELSGRPGGLGEIIAKQLNRQMTPVQAGAERIARTSTLAAYGSASVQQKNFIVQHSAAAAQAARESGIPASYMLGQAGHETGWGEREILTKDGSKSHNLFGIKASASWSGEVTEVKTTEYVNGLAHKSIAKFRVYSSPEESFRDYARLITQSPRYAQAKAQTASVNAYTQSLQKAGYATDPFYAAKLSRAINRTLELQGVSA